MMMNLTTCRSRSFMIDNGIFNLLMYTHKTERVYQNLYIHEHDFCSNISITLNLTVGHLLQQKVMCENSSFLFSTQNQNQNLWFLGETINKKQNSWLIQHGRLKNDEVTQNFCKIL